MPSRLGPLELLVILFIGVFFLVLPIRVLQKAGLSPWFALLFLVPYLNIIAMLWIAFAKWPIEKELQALRAQVASQPPPPPAGQ